MKQGLLIWFMINRCGYKLRFAVQLLASESYGPRIGQIMGCVTIAFPLLLCLGISQIFQFFSMDQGSNQYLPFSEFALQAQEVCKGVAVVDVVAICASGSMRFQSQMGFVKRCKWKLRLISLLVNRLFACYKLRSHVCLYKLPEAQILNTANIDWSLDL